MSDTEGDADQLPHDGLDGGSIKKETEGEPSVKESDGDVLAEESIGSLYDSNDFISGPSLSENGTLNVDILNFDFSYGYDCSKYFNLTVLDENTILFSSGNLLNFFNVETKEIIFRRSALGGGIGHIMKNPNPEFTHFAVAECGVNPIIIIYIWSSLDIVCILRDGAKKIYTYMDFSPDGELLVSQSGEPDYLITVWDWKHHHILLRTKSYVNDVYRVKFSPYVQGQLTTCGVAHIKFWKMAHTFTGLKLKGELGRFGKTEYSDIIGVLPMPDAKVVSGCSWGNILVWDDGLITFEVFRSLRKKCHDGPIVQFFYSDGELWTVSMDGHVKVWWFEKIDQADPPDDDRVILVDPTYDFYTPGLSLMAIEKRRPQETGDFQWFGQDKNGGLWLIDLNTEQEPEPSIQLFRCHAGKVRDMATCPFSSILASLGSAGRMFLYDYAKKKTIFEYKFPAPGVCLLWLPLELVPYGDTLIVGCEDGQVRVCCLNIPERFDEEKPFIKIVQIIKPHSKKMTTMAMNKSGNLLVTAAEDSTIFVFKMDVTSHKHCLTPIGFFPAVDIVTCMTWHFENETEILYGCIHGQITQVQLPEDVQSYTGVSFKLNLEPKHNRFQSYKSQIKRDIKISEIEERKAKKVEKKRKEMEKIKKENPGLEIDEETFLADSESEEELEPLYFPEVPSKIIWLKYTENQTIWLSMAGYDAGYIYEYKINQRDTIPLKFRIVDGGEDMEISSYIYNYNKKYLIFAMQDGKIRINKVNPNDYTDLTDYFQISMHDNQNGFIPRMCFSYDERYFFSCGSDNNIFAYKFQPMYYVYPTPRQRLIREGHVCHHTEDIDPFEKFSLEESKMKAENDRIQKVANEHKAAVRETLKHLKDHYKKILQRNSKLLPSQRIPREELEPDDRVAQHVEEVLQEKIDIVKRKLAYDVKKSEVQVEKLLNYITRPCDLHPNLVQGINKPGCAIMTVRQRIMPPVFYDMLKIIEQKMKEEQSKGRPPERQLATQKILPSKVEKTDSPLEFFLLSLSTETIKYRLGSKLNRMLNKYRKRRGKWIVRQQEWDDFMAKKPIPGRNHPDDEKFLEEAKVSFGDYKLKESHDYKVTREERETTVKHYKKLLETRGKQYNLRHNFIKQVFDIRDYKYELVEVLKEKQRRLDIINQELPENMRVNGPPIPKYDPKEYPEEKLKVKVLLPEEETEEIEVQIKTKLIEKPEGDALEKLILAACSTPKLVEGAFLSASPGSEVFRVQNATYEEMLSFPENTDTPFESCLKANRLNRLLFYQKLTISEMQELIDDFNDWIYRARKERLPILIRGNFIDIYIVCLNEELQILKSSEEQEDKLALIVHNKLSNVHSMEDILDNLKNDQEAYQIKLENFKSEETKIYEKFKMATENNKFYEFLKKVFKKKFKLPKLKGADDDSSESSSSSSDESDYDDTGSIDSRDFGFIKQDLNACPKGCEPAIYNLTVELRAKRHEIEQAEREEARLLELVKKEIDVYTRKLNHITNDYKECVARLEEYQREKQHKLNDVRTTVVLTLDQIYGFNPESSDIADFLVFSRSKLSELYKRVGELQSETVNQQTNHDTYLKHLMRMTKDIKYMKRKMHMLKKQIVTLLKDKFGKVVDINELELAIIQRSFHKNYVNELEEVVLKKLVYDLRLKMTDVRSLYIKELAQWQKKIDRVQRDLANEIKENTKRLELLTVISREKKLLSRFIDSQDKKRERVEHSEDIHKEFLKDMNKLEDIIEDQNRTIFELKEEIKMLKTKGIPPKSARERLEYKSEKLKKRKPDQEFQDFEEDEVLIKDWDFENFISDHAGEGEGEGPEDLSESEEEVEHADEPIVTEITIPGYYSTESEDVVKSLVEDLMQEIDTNLTKISTENLVKRILSNILYSTSVTSILTGIIDALPIEPDDEQLQIIETSAEKLFTIQEPQLSDGNLSCVMQDILEEVIAEAVSVDPHYLIPTMLEKLLENLPVYYISSNESIERIALAVKESSGDIPLDGEHLRKSIDRLPSEERMEIKNIINSILEEVYGRGIDYFCYI